MNIQQKFEHSFELLQQQRQSLTIQEKYENYCNQFSQLYLDSSEWYIFIKYENDNDFEKAYYNITNINDKDRLYLQIIMIYLLIIHLLKKELK